MKKRYILLSVLFSFQMQAAPISTDVTIHLDDETLNFIKKSNLIKNARLDMELDKLQGAVKRGGDGVLTFLPPSDLDIDSGVGVGVQFKGLVKTNSKYYGFLLINNKFVKVQKGFALGNIEVLDVGENGISIKENGVSRLLSADNV